MKDPYDHGHEDTYDMPSLSEALNIDRKAFIDPAKMAERKEITDARVEGYMAGKKNGFLDGLSVGIIAAVVVISTISALLR